MSEQVKPTMIEPKQIKVTEVRDLLKQGYYRLAKDDIGYGSIEAYYGLTPGDVTELFKHPKLRSLKTRIPSFVVVDDTEETSEVVMTNPMVERSTTQKTLEAEITDAEKDLAAKINS